MSDTVRLTRPSLPRGLGRAVALNAVWMNMSEVARYFLLVVPRMREALPGVPQVASSSLPIFLSWCLWDAILIVAVTGFCWLYLERFGATPRNALIAATLAWFGIFVIFWLALLNMSLADVRVVLVALPLSWLELAVAGRLTRHALWHTGKHREL